MKKIIIGTSVTLILLVVIGLAIVFFSLNSIVKKGVETYGPQLTKVNVTLGAVDLSPFSGSGTLSKLFVGNPEGYKTPSAFQMDSIKLAVKIGSVFSDTVVVDEINIQSPEITLEGTLDGNNLSTILNNLKGTNAAPTPTPAQNATPAGEKPAKKFIVKDLVLAGAKVNVNVAAMNKSLVKTLTIPDIHLQNIGTGEGGASAEELVRQILDPVLDRSVKAAADELAKQGIEEGKKEINKAVQNGLNNLLKNK